MKKRLVKILAVMAAVCLVIPLFSSCSAFDSSIEARLRRLSIGRGYSTCNFWRSMTRTGQAGDLSFWVCPKEFSPKSTYGAQIISKNGTDYKIREEQNFRTLSWESDGHLFSMNVQPKKSWDIASPETAEKLMTDPLAVLDGLEILMDSWLNRFSGNGLIIEVYLYQTQSAEHNGWGMMMFEDYNTIVEGDLEYYYHAGGGIHKDMVDMFWNTDIGLFQINGGPGPNNGGDAEKAKAEAFINADLIRKITLQMGANIMPLQVSTSSPN